MGDLVREPVVVPWTVDCVPVVPANLASLFITSYLVLSTPATRRLIHVCICFATGTTPSVSSICQRIVFFRTDISLCFVDCHL